VNLEDNGGYQVDINHYTVTFDAKGKYAYVMNFSTTTVSIIDIAIDTKRYDVQDKNYCMFSTHQLCSDATWYDKRDT